MGNVALCAPSAISSGVVKILSDDGKLVIHTKPVKAAEIMLENPGHFVCDSCHLKVGQRIPGASADEELEPGQIYFLLPMDILYSVLTNEEMNCLSERASKGLKHGISKIFPVLGDFCLFPNSGLNSSSSSSSSSSDLQQSERFSRQRSWEPALETIVETPPRT